MKPSLKLSTINGRLRPLRCKVHVQKRFFKQGTGLSKEQAVKEQEQADTEDYTDAAGAQRDFYLSVLNSTNSNRDARQYLKRFSLPSALSLKSAKSESAASAPATSTDEPATSEFLKSRNQAYVNRLHENRSLDKSLTHTKQLVRKLLFVPEIGEEQLHVALMKVRDVSNIDEHTLRGIGRTMTQLHRLGLCTIFVVDEPISDDVKACEWRAVAESQADRIVEAIEKEHGKARRVDGVISRLPDGSAEISMPNLLIAPLARGLIPVLTPAAFDAFHRVVPTEADSVVLALSKLLSTQPPSSVPSVEQPVSLDRIIFIDPLGGTPAVDRPNGAHVFVNMQQEYAAIKESLFTHEQQRHLRNLETLRESLAILPATTSAVITTPEAAAASRKVRLSALATPDGKPRSKNPLIHNLLTDKPIFSSSLPSYASPKTQTTILKHGTPLTILPSGTKLTDPQIDLPKLVALIEDSFGKALDVDHYLHRVNENIAGLIIAGDYEGAAIMTWETAPNLGGEKVAYLDKFAVLKRAQGAGGVADVVFKAMAAGVRPGGMLEDAEGIVWRSRRENPVNKWYFERAKGTWKIPNTYWTMFWTTQDVEVGKRRFLEYADICRNIEPNLRDAAG